MIRQMDTYAATHKTMFSESVGATGHELKIEGWSRIRS
jgi:hypothetical protein